MVHAAWDLMLSAPSKNPSISLNDAVGAVDSTSNVDSTHYDQQARSPEATGKADHSSDSGSSSSGWYSDQTSSAELTDGPQDNVTCQENGAGAADDATAHEQQCTSDEADPAAVHEEPGAEVLPLRVLEPDGNYICVLSRASDCVGCSSPAVWASMHGASMHGTCGCSYGWACRAHVGSNRRHAP